VTAKRTELLTIRVAPEEMRMIKALAEADGITASDVVRMFVRRLHAERFGSKPSRKPKRK
jgi:antitoxin component of RelBE/YafQ-DinJ toxin-antitoxin module